MVIYIFIKIGLDLYKCNDRILIMSFGISTIKSNTSHVLAGTLAFISPQQRGFIFCHCRISFIRLMYPWQAIAQAVAARWTDVSRSWMEVLALFPCSLIGKAYGCYYSQGTAIENAGSKPARGFKPM